MKTAWAFVLVALLCWRLIWFSNSITLSGGGMKSRVGSRVRNRSNSGRAEEAWVRFVLASWDWPTFDEDVPDEELHGYNHDFLEVGLYGLDRIIRFGQVDLGVDKPQTVRGHIETCERIVERHRESRGFSDRGVLKLRLAFRTHEIGELVTTDLPLFPLSEDKREKRREVKSFVPPTLEEERRRWRKEWQRERPFLVIAISGLSPRRRKIALYLFDWFYLGRDRLARFGRNVHYFEPVESIHERTKEADNAARVMHLRRARAVITDEGLLEELNQRFGGDRESEEAEKSA